MKARSGKIFLNIAVAGLFCAAFMWRCANEAAPQGGDRDTLPPRILSAAPDFNTTRFNSKRIYITFDEYVVLKDQQKEFFVSPPMEKNPILTIRGRGVQIDIRDSLQPNTTYVINFGSSVVDNNEGNPLHGFRYVFSTGDEIDSLLTSGYVADAFKKDSISKALLFFYDAAADSMLLDSTVFKSRPLAVGRAETNGIFLAQNLKPMDYRVYAIDDVNGNFTYDPGTDKIAFLDGTVNPLDLIDFHVSYDSTWMYLVPEPQLYFRAFTDTHFKRQNLSANTRPEQQRINLIFNAPFPQIDTLRFEGIDPQNIITEYLTPGRDTINLWLNVPPEQLPDTIKGRISYMRHDSLNILRPYGTDLKLAWRYVESREERRAREREERRREEALEKGEEYQEPEKPNLFGFNLTVSSELNPEHDFGIIFDKPITAIDTARISLTREDEELGLKYRVDYSFSQDTLDMRRYNIGAAWQEGQKYELLIPDGVFTDIAGYRNDTIKHGFATLSPDKLSIVNVRVTGKTPESLYVLTLRDKNGNTIQEKKYVSSGTYTFRYLEPGEVKLHILEDINGNGEWDTGNVIERRQPERIEIFGADTGTDNIMLKANWEIDLNVDMNELFKPIDIMDIRQHIRKSEELRKARLAEEAEKKRQQEERNQNSSSRNNSGSTGSTFRNF